MQQCTFLSAICILRGTTLSHDRLGLPMEAFRSRSMTHSRRPTWRNGFSSLMLLLYIPTPKVRVMFFHETPNLSMPVSSSPWGPPKNQDPARSWERIEAPLPPLQPQSTCARLELPFSCDAILSGYEDLVSSGSDQLTMWGKVSPQEILAKHVVDIHTVVADFRHAFERISLPLLSPMASTNTFSSQSPVQKRLNIYN